MELDFIVTVCLGRGDGGDFCVAEEVSEEEHELLKQCCREDEEIDGYDGLEDLAERLREDARCEAEAGMEDTDEETDFENVEYIIHMPGEVCREIEAEENDGEESAENDEESTGIDWGDYDGCPFAMETVNGEIISLTADFQKKITKRIINKLRIKKQELTEYLIALANDDAHTDERFELLEDCEFDMLADILGFDLSEEAFSAEGIGMLESPYGWEAKELLEVLGFELERDTAYIDSCAGSEGVIYIPEEE